MGSTRIPYLCGGGDTPEQPAPEARWAPLDTHYGAWGCTPTRTTVPPRGHPLLPPNPQQPLRIPPAGPQGSMTPPMFMFLPPPTHLMRFSRKSRALLKTWKRKEVLGAVEGEEGGGTHDTAPTSSLGTPSALPGEPRGWGRLRNALASPVPRVCARVAARGAVSHTPAQKRRPPRNRGRPGEGELHAFPPLPHRHRRRAREDRRPRRGTTAVGGRANRPRPSPICRLSPAN